MKGLRSRIWLVAALCAAPVCAQQPQDVLTPMPPALETDYALSALPPSLRRDATVYLLDPAKGYRLARQGSSGVACVVQRTVWEMGELRDDIFIPLCYDAVGVGTYLRVIMETAELRAQGTGATELKTLIAGRFRDGTYRAPAKAGVSYMVAPVMRTVGPPDMKIHTMAMPHLMFYAPGVTNADLGARPDLADPDSLRWPFIDRQGTDEQSYMIQMVGDTEKARILTDQRPLLEALCAHREVLCLAKQTHQPMALAKTVAAPGRSRGAGSPLPETVLTTRP